jgi:hypothetical protein
MRCREGTYLQGLRPEEVLRLTRRHADATSWPYLRRYVPPRNRGRPVDVAIIEVLNAHIVSLAADVTPCGVRSGWVANFGSEYTTQRGLW